MKNMLKITYAVVLAVTLLGCHKRQTLSEDEMMLIDKSITETRLLIEKASKLKVKAEAGDFQAAEEWQALTRENSNSTLPIARAVKVLSPLSTGMPEVDAKRLQVATLEVELTAAGFFSLRPTWVLALRGDQRAQDYIFEYFTGENLGSDQRVVLDYGDQSVDWAPWPTEPKIKAVLPSIKVIKASKISGSYGFMADLFWTPPTLQWDSTYVEGLYYYDGIKFAPRDWLVKAAEIDAGYKPKLAALDFISAKDEAQREVAARTLLSFTGENSGYAGSNLIDECLAAIHLRGITVPVDFAKAAQIMLSSSDNALKARGVKLVCEHNLPFEQKDVQNGHNNEELLHAICSKYGYANWRRDFERAYFEYWLFLWRINGSPGGDANFARMEIAELESRLTPAEIISLQKKCWEWAKKFEWKSPHVDDWLVR